MFQNRDVPHATNESRRDLMPQKAEDRCRGSDLDNPEPGLIEHPPQPVLRESEIVVRFLVKSAQEGPCEKQLSVRDQYLPNLTDNSGGIRNML